MCWRCSASACAVNAIIGVCLPLIFSSCRILRVASRPSITGIWISMKTRSILFFFLKASTASSPLQNCADQLEVGGVVVYCQHYGGVTGFALHVGAGFRIL